MEDACRNWAIIAFQEESFRRMRSGIQGTAEVLKDKEKKDRISSEQEENIISLETIERDGKLHELSEKYIKEVQLPADIVKIGSCAFYNCTKMERISVYPKLVEVGSDAFMNCLNLRSLRMCWGRGADRTKTASRADQMAGGSIV